MFNVFKEKWMVKQPIPYNKREMMYIILDILDIPYNINLRVDNTHRYKYSHIGVWVDNKGAIMIYGLGDAVFPVINNVEYTIDEVLEALKSTVEEKETV